MLWPQSKRSNVNSPAPPRDAPSAAADKGIRKFKLQMMACAALGAISTVLAVDLLVSVLQDEGSLFEILTWFGIVAVAIVGAIFPVYLLLTIESAQISKRSDSEEL